MVGSRTWKKYAVSVLVPVLWVAGCVTQQEKLLRRQGMALDTAVSRGRFELSCPEATGAVLSSNVIEPVRWRGIERNEYTIGVSGCGKKSTYIVICRETSDSCVARSGENRTFRGK